MIIIGYQGIGKSSIAKENPLYIDLDSSWFYVDGCRAEDWYKVYCNIAIELSKQGYNVFISSHKCVRTALAGLNEKVCVCYPSLDLKVLWIDRLKDRYNQTREAVHYRAWMDAKTNYDESIKDIESDCKRFHFIKKKIKNMDYDLLSLLG